MGEQIRSLIAATLALPHALRGLDLPDESPHHQAAEDEARLLAAETAVSAIESAQRTMAEGREDAYRYAIAAAKIVDLYRLRIDRYGGAADAALGSENDEIERQLRLVGLRAERREILRIGRSRGIDDTRLRNIVNWICKRRGMAGEGAAGLAISTTTATHHPTDAASFYKRKCLFLNNKLNYSGSCGACKKPSLTLGPSAPLQVCPCPGGRGKKSKPSLAVVFKPFSPRDQGTLKAEQKGWDEGRGKGFHPNLNGYQ